MTLPASWTQVPVVGSFIDLHGNPCRGRITFTSNQVVVIDGKTVVPKVITAVLVAGSLPDGFELPSTNDADLSPVGWAYQVREHFDGGRSYGISVPYDAVSIDLATVAPIVQPDEQATVLQIQLAGLSTDTGGVITDEDTILSAHGKLQRQILDVVDTARGVVEAANFAALPGTGAAEIIYITLDDDKMYRWDTDTDAYVELTAAVSGTTDDVAEGGSNLYFTVARVRSVVLTGLSTATNAVIAATDTVLEAFGKLQAQVTANLATLTGHTGNTSNPHSVTAVQVGADPTGTAAAAIGVHEAAGDPHPQYTSAGEAAAAAPVQSVSGRTGDVTLTSSDVGLGNVNNTSDANKPVSTAAQTALDLKAPIANPTFTGTVAGITKSMVGLGNVDNVSDANKPVSTAAQTALDLKAPLASPTFTGTVAGITKSMVGLGSADNTSDADKPVSSATQTALNLKADSSALTTHTGNTSNPHGVTAAQVGADPTGTAASAVSAHEADATAVHAASAISNTPSGNIAATDVQAAINELDAEKLGTAGDATNLTNTIAPQTTAATSKTTPVDADALPITDSAASNGLKKLTWANLKATLLAWLQGTVFPSPGAIGGTAPAAGAFTTVSASGNVVIGGAAGTVRLGVYDSGNNFSGYFKSVGGAQIVALGNVAGVATVQAFTTDSFGAYAPLSINGGGGLTTVGGGFAVTGSLSATGNIGGGCTALTPLQIRTASDQNFAVQSSTSTTGGVKINAFNNAADTSVPMEIDGSVINFNIGATKKAEITSTGINNTVIGATTPAAGAFTTLSASDNTTSGSGGTGTTNALLVVNGSSASSYGSSIRLQRNSVNTAQIGQESGINGGTSDDLAIYVGSANTNIYGGGVKTAVVSATGLAVTGAMNATTSISAGTAGGSYLLNVVGNGGTGACTMSFVDTSNSNKEWRVDQSSGTLRFIESGVGTPLILSSAGVAVTGAMNATGAVTAAGIGLNAGPISAGTSPTWLLARNSSGGDFFFGKEGATPGGYFTGTAAYDNVIYGANAIKVIVDGTVSGAFTASGLTVAGALSASGNIKLANAFFLQGRNAANSADVPIVKVNASDALEFGSGGYPSQFTGPVEVTGALSATGVIQTSDSVNLGVSGSGGQLNYYGDVSGYFEYVNRMGSDKGYRWYTGAGGGAIGMTLDASGNLLAGQTVTGLSNSNSHALDVRGWSYINHGVAATSGDFYTIFGYNNGSIGSITQSGTTAVAYNTTSDHRLKTNVRPAAAYRFMDIEFVDFEWVDGRHDCGVIAHQLQSVYPDLVIGEKDATEVRTVEITPAIPAVTEQVLVTPAVEAVPEELDEEGNVIQSAVAAVEAVYETVEVTPAVPAVTEEQTFPVYQQVNYMGLIGRMGARVQQLQRTVDDQAALIEAMEARLTALEQA